MQRAIIDLNLEPRVYTIDNFASPAECNHMIACAAGEGLNRAFVAGAKKGVVSKGRTNDMCWLDHDADPACLRIAKRVSALVGLPLAHSERFQMIHYSQGAEYKPHFDAFDPKTPNGKRTWRSGGQRLITVLGYLNTPAKGGATVFPKLKLSVPAEQGKLVVFHNCLPGTDVRHPHSLHGGAPVEAGEKWAFNLWFRTGFHAKEVAPR